MKIHEGLDAQGHLLYFEVSRAFFSRRAACDLVSGIAGASIATRPKPWSSGNDIFCRFTLDGRQFELWEPFGDNSRFHVAANPLEPCAALDRLRLAFQEHAPVSGIARWLLLIAALSMAWFWASHA